MYKHKQKYCDRARELINEGRKLDAVKLIWDNKRGENFGLKEAKEFVDFEIFKTK